MDGKFNIYEYGWHFNYVENESNAFSTFDYDEALMKVSKQRSNLGAYQNRLELTAQGLMIAYENTAASESRIRDTDMSKEMVAFSKDMILENIGQAMLAQANQSNQGVLSLLQ